MSSFRPTRVRIIEHDRYMRVNPIFNPIVRPNPVKKYNDAINQPADKPKYKGFRLSFHKWLVDLTEDEYICACVCGIYIGTAVAIIQYFVLNGFGWL